MANLAIESNELINTTGTRFSLRPYKRELSYDARRGSPRYRPAIPRRLPLGRSALPPRYPFLSHHPCADDREAVAVNGATARFAFPNRISTALSPVHSHLAGAMSHGDRCCGSLADSAISCPQLRGRVHPALRFL
jgi:hypothetical protein